MRPTLVTRGFFSRSSGSIFRLFGEKPIFLLTETGNRARKVSGTHGKCDVESVDCSETDSPRSC